jgi:hypothetical protein
MSGIRNMPLRYMACASVAFGIVLPKPFHLLEFETHVVETVFYAFFAQVFVWSIYLIFIYPHFLSPLRHLPQPKGGIPFIGHSWALGKYGPGVLGRKWYFNYALPPFRQCCYVSY